MPELKAGDTFPEGVTFQYIAFEPDTAAITSCGIPTTYDASKEFKDKKVVVVSVPGAFTPTCQVSHLASYVNRVADLKAKGVDQVVFIAYNDAFVMSAWGKANGIKDNFIIFASDPGAKFSSTHGWVMGERTGRYALVVDHGKVVYAAEDSQKGSIEFSGADAVLAKL